MQMSLRVFIEKHNAMLQVSHENFSGKTVF